MYLIIRKVFPRQAGIPGSVAEIAGNFSSGFFQYRDSPELDLLNGITEMVSKYNGPDKTRRSAPLPWAV